MTGGFVALIFGFCAGMTDTGSIQLGYQSNGECIVQLEADGDGDGVVVEGHTLGWEMLQGGAEVTIDDQKFVVVHLPRA